MTATPSRHPLDFEALDKGSVIPVERIEKITGHAYGTMSFQLGLLQLRDRVKKELLLRGLVVCIESDNGSLHILTDAEASPYASDRTHQHLRAAARNHRDLLAVDVAKLTEQEKAEHERRIIRDGRYIQALAQTRTDVKAVVHRRSVPGLPSGGISHGSNDAQDPGL